MESDLLFFFFSVLFCWLSSIFYLFVFFRYSLHPQLFCTSQAAVVVKNSPGDAGDIRDAGLILVREDPLEKGMATYSSTLAWRIL